MTNTSATAITRRSILVLGLPVYSGCGTPLPLSTRPVVSPAAAVGAARLAESAQMHGLAAYRQMNDINISYDGQWRPLIDRIQPLVVDKGFRGSSEERLLPAVGINAQSFRGPAGHKQVLWRRQAGAGASAAADSVGTVAVWFNGQRSTDPAAAAASAVVAEAYGLFLLGPLWLVDRGLEAEWVGTERINGRLCDVVNVWLTPGLGLVALDRVAVFIDRDDAITRRVRFTLEGYSGTQGAVAETDTFEHERRHGVLWPMRSYEEVVHPLRVPAHDWHVTGLDVNRGYDAQALAGPQFSGLALAPAGSLTAGLRIPAPVPRPLSR